MWLGWCRHTIVYIDPAEALNAILMTQLASRLGWRLMVEVFPNLVYQAIVDKSRSAWRTRIKGVRPKLSLALLPT